MSKSRGKVLLAMSGGVDSSVAAALLMREGWEVVGCFMRLGSPGDAIDELQLADAASCKIGKQGCCSINDAADARLVAAKLGIPFYVCNFKRDFGRIIEYFVDEYNAGRTPNPCIRCNDWLKFGKLHEYAQQIDAQYIASGHYARIDRTDPDQPRLARGVDHDKDQSYVLFGMKRTQIDSMMLPIGELTKPEVRALAQQYDLPVFNKPDSQEICFVPDNDYAGLVARRTPDEIAPGVIVDTNGTPIGEHQGHQHFTIGQRRGIRIAGDVPLYVINKDASANTITVGAREHLAASGCTALEANWFVDASTQWRACLAQIRYNARGVPARVRATDDRALEVQFDDPQDAIAPGQAVVCYDDTDRVLCGGWINTAE